MDKNNNLEELMAGEESIMNDVSDINKMIEDEKKKQVAETSADINSVMAGEESIMDDVSNINKMIEDEKKKQVAETSKKTEPIIFGNGNAQNYEPLKVEMERLHLRIINDTIDILYRPNHCYIAFVPNDENGKAEVKRVAEMSREEFSEYLNKSNCFSFSTLHDIENIKKSSNESWYKNAWSVGTKKLLDELGVLNPVEEVLVRTR